MSNSPYYSRVAPDGAEDMVTALFYKRFTPNGVRVACADMSVSLSISLFFGR